MSDKRKPLNPAIKISPSGRPYLDKKEAVRRMMTQADNNPPQPNVAPELKPCPFCGKSTDRGPVRDYLQHKMDCYILRGTDDNRNTRATQPATASADDYEEVLADHRRLVRELDQLLNRESAAEQAGLVDIVAQLRTRTTPPDVTPDLAAPSDVDRFLFRVAGKDCERLTADTDECSSDLPFTDWCSICQARGLIQKYSRPPDITERARRAVSTLRAANILLADPTDAELAEAADIIAAEFK
jgi:hypothetical protein